MRSRSVPRRSRSRAWCFVALAMSPPPVQAAVVVRANTDHLGADARDHRLAAGP